LNSLAVDQVSEDSIFKIGRVISVDGRLVRVKVDKTKNTSHLLYKGELLKNVSVGGYIKIVKGFTKIIGKVNGEFVEEDKQFSKREYASEKEKISRTLSVSLLGFFKGCIFVRGIKELPLVDNECFLLHNREFNQVHNFLQEGDEPITLGTLSLEKGQKIEVGVNSLFASHIGIFGNTGSGKSYTLAKVYRELFEKYKDRTGFKENAQFLLIDFNGEYVDAEDNVIVEKQYKNVYKLSTRARTGGDRFPVSMEALNNADFWITFLEATEKTQTPFLHRAVNNTFIAPKLRNETDLKNVIARMIASATIGGDRNLEKTIVINFLTELKNCLDGNSSIGTLLDDYRARLQFHSGQSKFYYQSPQGQDIYSDKPQFRSGVIDAKMQQVRISIDQLGPVDSVRLQIIIQYFDDIIRGFANKEHLAPLISRMDKRIDDLKKVIKVEADNAVIGARNITIVSLRDVNIRIRKILPLLLCKRLYDDKKAENDEGNYLNIIIDEAHNILSEQSERESEQWKDYRLETFEEIIKEGRKFGVFLTIASQRPSDISPTIISQLHNYFLHRLINNEDIKAVEKTISYLDKVSFEYLPILPTGTCIFAGLLASVPVVVDIPKMDSKFEPRNKTRTLVDQWK
jgi:DNA helicase HerA-like ATPase